VDRAQHFQAYPDWDTQTILLVSHKNKSLSHTCFTYMTHTTPAQPLQEGPKPRFTVPVNIHLFAVADTTMHMAAQRRLSQSLDLACPRFICPIACLRPAHDHGQNPDYDMCAPARVKCEVCETQRECVYMYHPCNGIQI
jgi:hypothetical protein